MAVRIVIAPDALKGGPSAAQAAEAIAAGWRSRRDDELVVMPLADGGEGTLDALASAVVGARRHVVAVTGPDGRPVDAPYLLLPDGGAVVELAATSGLPLMRALDPLGAHTTGLGEAIAAALDAGADRLSIAVGGSATTDGGTGALTVLGLRLIDGDGDGLPAGGGALRRLATVDAAGLRAPPPGGVEVLTDVTTVLTGPQGAAAVFGPQKGADADEIAELDAALTRLAEVLGGRPDEPGAGAAGGTAYGFATLWDAELRAGSSAIAAHAGLRAALETADLVITGEGSLDATSFAGKVVGTVVTEADRSGVPVAVVAGHVDEATAAGRPGLITVSLSELAGSARASLAEPLRFLEHAGARLADEFSR